MLLSVFMFLFDRLISHACVFIFIRTQPLWHFDKALLWFHVGALAFTTENSHSTPHELEIFTSRVRLFFL